MLLAVTCVAFVLAFFASLPTVLPRWGELLARIESARSEPVRDGLHRGFQFEFNDWPQPTGSTYVIGAAIAIAFYAAKHLILRLLKPLDLRVFAYVCLVTLVLPHIYLNWTSWSAVNLYFLGHLLFMPIAVLAVPTGSFLIDATRAQQPSAGRYAMRSAVESFVLTPIWWFVWSVVMLFTGLVWI